MKALLFLARRFSFEPFAATLPEAPPPAPAGSIEEAVVVFFHCEAEDELDHPRVLRRLLKQVKWLAGKKGFRRVVLHTFTHLSTSSASPEFAQTFLEEMARRLRQTGYEVLMTPFGYTCSWDLAVCGESLAKVFVSF